MVLVQATDVPQAEDKMVEVLQVGNLVRVLSLELAMGVHILGLELLVLELVEEA